MLNKVQLIGRLGRDPEVRYTTEGKCVANLAIATSESHKDKATGETRQETEWHRVALFGPTGDVAARYLKKGKLVFIEGRIRTRKWQDKSGQDRYTTEIVGHEMLCFPATENPRTKHNHKRRRFKREQGQTQNQHIKDGKLRVTLYPSLGACPT